MSINNPYVNKFLVIANIRIKNVNGAITPMLRVFNDLKSASDFYDKIKTDDNDKLDSLYLIEGTLLRTKVFSGMGAVLRDEDFSKQSTVP
jgi:hypothetical protein